MKIIDWEGLKELPEGTIYQFYTPHTLSDPVVLGGVRGNTGHVVEADFLPQAMFGCTWPEEDRARLGMTDNDNIISSPSMFGREDYHDDKKKYRFLVWEKADRERFARWLLMEPQDLADEMNSDTPTILVIDDKDFAQ